MRVRLETAVWRWLGHFKGGRSAVGELSAETTAYLARENPKLKELKERYSRFTKWPHSSWSSWEDKVDLLRFRGENDYLSQAYFRDTQTRYELTTAYVELTDRMGLLGALTEDNLFGVKLWEVLPDKPVTRDLLDSIIEINFLKETLGLDAARPVRVLDIGAGYGRFAHRFTSAFPDGHVTCIDAVATSTFLSDFYLGFRKCAARTAVVPFDRVETLSERRYDVAINIHSWSECTREFVRFWLGVVRDLQIPYLFIVPHFAGFTTKEPDGTTGSYEEELQRHGFRQHLRRRKFHGSAVLDRRGIYPADYWVFKRA